MWHNVVVNVGVYHRMKSRDLEIDRSDCENVNHKLPNGNTSVDILVIFMRNAFKKC